MAHNGRTNTHLERRRTETTHVTRTGTDAVDDPAQIQRCERFTDLHDERPFVLANAWDAGSARMLESMGFPALATTSSGTALRAGRLDYHIDADTSIAVAAELAAAVEVPVSVDFEDGFGLQPESVAANVERLVATGVAGFSIEDYTRDSDHPIHEVDLASERIAAAAEVAHAGPARLVLTARTELLTNRSGRSDRAAVLAEVVERLRRYQLAGADVLFAPGLRTPEEITLVLSAVDLPVSVMAVPGLASVADLGALGVARVSLAGWLAYAAMDGLRAAALEVVEHGTFEFTRGLTATRESIVETFRS